MDTSYVESLDRKSIVGYIFSFNGTPILWSSRKQSIVALALSSTTTEYVAFDAATKEALFLSKLANVLGLRRFHYDLTNGSPDLSNAIIIYTDLDNARSI